MKMPSRGLGKVTPTRARAAGWGSGDEDVRVGRVTAGIELKGRGKADSRF